MLVQAQGYRYNVPKRRRITHEVYTRRYKLASLENKLIRERQVLENLPGCRRSRQREKIFRIEQQIDRLRLEIESEQ